MLLRNTPYRALAVVYTAAILIGIFEYSRDPGNVPDIYGDSVRNFPMAVARLYPGRPESEYLLGRRLEAIVENRFNRVDMQRDPAMLRQFLNDWNVSLHESAQHYERAIDLGMKSEEDLLYNYAITLIRIRADPRRIDQAIAAWRYHFPFSERRALELRRQAIERELRQFPVAVPDVPSPDAATRPERTRDGA